MATNARRRAGARQQWRTRGPAVETRASNTPAPLDWTGAWRPALPRRTSPCVAWTGSDTGARVLRAATRSTLHTQETARAVSGDEACLGAHPSILSLQCVELSVQQVIRCECIASFEVVAAIGAAALLTCSPCWPVRCCCPYRVLCLPAHLVPLLRQQRPVRPLHLCQLLLRQVQQRPHHQVSAARGRVLGQVRQV